LAIGCVMVGCFLVGCVMEKFRLLPLDAAVRDHIAFSSENERCRLVPMASEGTAWSATRWVYG
jgi:hypothetical protein